MVQTPSLKDMLEAGVHVGHLPSRWHPKMAPYLLQRAGRHVINLEETQKALTVVLDYVKGLAAQGGIILFVGTKPQARQLVKTQAIRAGMPYVNERWLGGTLTNFSEIKRVIKRLQDLRGKRDSGELKKYTKQEQVWMARDIDDMEGKVGGIEKMTQMPEAVFLADIRTDKTAFREARQKKIIVIALVDSNVNPTDVVYPIPANDDGVKSIGLMLSLVADAVIEGRLEQEMKKEKEEKKIEKEVVVLDGKEAETKMVNENEGENEREKEV